MYTPILLIATGLQHLCLKSTTSTFSLSNCFQGQGCRGASEGVW